MKTAFTSLFFVLALSPQVFSQTDRREWRQTIREDLFQKYQNEISLFGQDPKRMKALNEKLMAELNHRTVPRDPVRAPFITLEQAEAIMAEARNHPVVGAAGRMKYDPESRMGFCFGRAAFTHLELLRRGVLKESIHKAFVVGEMHTGSIVWRYHVTTIVRGPGGSWIAMDPIFEAPLELNEWYKRMLTFSKTGAVRLYVTHPSKIGPNGWEYNLKPGGLTHPEYNNYFMDMFKTFKSLPKDSYKNTSCDRIHN